MTPERTSSGPIRRRLTGIGDVVWILVTAAAVGTVVVLLIAHLRVEFQMTRLANERAELVAETRDLEEEQRRLEVELQLRREQVDLPEVARDELGMAAPPPERVLIVEEVGR